MNNDRQSPNAQQSNAQRGSAQPPSNPDPGKHEPARPSVDPVGPPGMEMPSKPPMQEFPAKPERDLPMPDRERAQATSAQVEGEGSYTAAHRYAEGLTRSVQQGDSDQLADEAADALDGPEGNELRQAEQQAKQGSPAGAAAQGNSQSRQGSSRSDKPGAPQSFRGDTGGGQRQTQPFPRNAN
jgi:hypothetical protein